MLSIQTNVNSLVAQQNLNVNTQFQSNTIEQLTSGYRINSSSDDAAGLAVANTFRDNIVELTQGVQNANDGVSQLQIADGGLTNISNILDRLKTLATESASSTFTGNRSTLNNEYQSLLTEINRQASNIGMVTNGSMNNQLQVYIGGGSSQGNAQVSVDLSGTKNTVDSAGLGVGSTSIDQGGVSLTGNNVTSLNNANYMVMTGQAAGSGQTLAIKYVDSAGATQTLNASVTSTSTTGISVSAALQQLNTQLSTIGLQAAVNSTGSLVIGGTAAFEVTGVTNSASAPTNLLATAGANNTINTGDYNTSKAFTKPDGTPQILAFSNGSVTQYVTLDGTATNGQANAADNAADAVSTINTVTHSLGIYAFADASGNINLQGSGSFSVTAVQQGAASGGGAAGWGTDAAGTEINPTAPSASQSSTGNALAALTAINSAVGQLGQVQGRVGAGENQLNYAISLAQSQITNFSSAQSQIRDADIAAEAANLSKAQVLQQASIAAMAQANSAPQAVLSLLKG
jgi:flagellin